MPKPRRDAHHHPMASFLFIVTSIIYLAIAIFVLTLLSRLVSAHEKVAKSLEEIARRPADRGQ